MNILLISQCSKNALTETRRILDHFAERKGDCVWQTDITDQGLQTLRSLLKKSAKRNTAVACHWLKNNNMTELIWIVGDRTRFNDKGNVPTNYTYSNILRNNSENNWQTGHAIALLSSLAGLFHDFGKANDLFQEKLKKKKNIFEPCRHEWVSLRLFLAFITEKFNESNEAVYLSDEQWLQKLVNIKTEDEEFLLKNLIKDNQKYKRNPFSNSSLPNLAKIVAWLIVTHHKLPQYLETVEKKSSSKPKSNKEPKLETIDQWFSEEFENNVDWNSNQINNDNWVENDFIKVWQFSTGTPIKSKTWREKANKIAYKAIKNNSLLCNDFLSNDKFSTHLARLCLMLGDHSYSAAEAKKTWQDSSFKAIANTNKQTKKAHQKLDEHNIGVAYFSFTIAKILPKLRDYLPSIQNNKQIKKRSDNPKFQWQDKAYDFTNALKQEAMQHGFFGINMASTGCGKTLANSKIMFAIADEKKGCRFNVALGLRTLTLQTGDALKEKLKILEEDIAVLIGSQGVKELYELAKKKNSTRDNEINKSNAAENDLSDDNFTGSESSEYFSEDSSYVKYDGALPDNIFNNFIKHNPKFQKLLNAPILVTTIDHLIPATEGTRGGKQIAPILRLLTSDLVLDEPDDFDLQDLPALCRLVNWAGMLGSRVLLSSATIPPDLVKALFIAYLEGRKVFEKACTNNTRSTEVCCAWFDEFSKPKHSLLQDDDTFLKEHELFVEKRVQNLLNLPAKRKAEIVEVHCSSIKPLDVLQNMSDTIYNSIYKLHDKHHSTHKESKKKISIGLVRMANINPMVAVAKNIMTREHSNNFVFHFCVYHSQYPLIMRANIEEILDQLLTRHDPNKIWTHSYFKKHVLNNKEENHVFVIFATSIAEVGRDHDYDWAIIEPSSMRSIIQIAGRVLRHRNILPDDNNIYILNKNYKGLQKNNVCYTKPGFESDKLNLVEKDLFKSLPENDYKIISSIPRIRKNNKIDAVHNFIDLEHMQLNVKLFGGNYGDIFAEMWWKYNITWSAELQRRSIFRLNYDETKELFWYLKNEEDEPILSTFNSKNLIDKVSFYYIFNKVNSINLNNKSKIINNIGLKYLIIDISARLNISLEKASIYFAKINLKEQEEQEHYSYFPELGVFKDITI